MMLFGMHRFLSVAAILGFSFTSSSMGLNIMLTNDDSWASANIRSVGHYFQIENTKLTAAGRATYSALKAAGHAVVLVA